MSENFEHKVVVVTGGSKGIGLAVARLFARAQARVVIVSRTQANLDEAERTLAVQGLRVWPIAADLSDAEQAEQAIARVEETLGPIDVLVNSAGAAQRAEPEDLDPARWRAALDAKFFPYIHAQHAVLKRLRARSSDGVAGQPVQEIGAIVNIVGTGGKQPTRTHLAGGSANAALLLSTVGLAAHYARYGIRINAINPGFTLTGRVEQHLRLEAARQGVSQEAVLAASVAQVPLGRYGRAEEVAEVALFLASSRASYVVGAIIPMDGGSGPAI